VVGSSVATAYKRHVVNSEGGGGKRKAKWKKVSVLSRCRTNLRSGIYVAKRSVETRVGRQPQVGKARRNACRIMPPCGTVGYSGWFRGGRARVW